MLSKPSRIGIAPPRIPTSDSRRVPPPPKTADPIYYSREWRSLIARIIRVRGRRCEDPAHVGLHDPKDRLFGDHIVELRDGGELLDPSNVMLRCGSCHTRKTIEVRRERAGREPSPRL